MNQVLNSNRATHPQNVAGGSAEGSDLYDHINYATSNSIENNSASTPYNTINDDDIVSEYYANICDCDA